MKMPFKVECYSDKSLGVVLDTYKNSNYYYMKILLSVIRTRVSIIKNVQFPWSSPGGVKTFYKVVPTDT